MLMLGKVTSNALPVPTCLTISFQREGPLSTLMTATKDPAQSSVSYNKHTFSQETI